MAVIVFGKLLCLAVALLLLLCCSLERVAGHARLRNPPSRATMWRYDFDNPADYNDNQGFCGGASVRHHVFRYRFTSILLVTSW